MADQPNKIHQRAVAALNSGDFPTLVQHCRAILEQDKQYADAWFLLSIAAEAGRKPHKAVELVDKALSLSDDNSEYLAQKARYHLALNQDRAALDSTTRALALNPTRALTLDTLGVILTRLGHYRRAAETLTKAVAAKPDNPQFHFNLASAEQFLGHLEQAREHYQAAIKLAPRFARAYWALSELEKNRVDNRHLTAMQALFEKPDTSAEDQLYLGHAIARGLEQLEDYSGAFTTLVRCKQAKREQTGYESSVDQTLFSALQEAFSTPKTTTPSNSTGNTAAPLPLFVVGMPRSGTTLVERIVSSHNNVESLGELQALPLAVNRASGLVTQQALTADVIHAAANLTDNRIAEYYNSAVELRLAGQGGDTLYFIDKLPLNFLYIGFIMHALPKAKIVCVRRNPADTILSNFRQLFAVNFSYYNYHYDLVDTARYFVLFDQLMDHWQSLFGDQLLEVSYDRLVANPEPIAREILDYLALPWDANCLTFHTNPTAVATASTAQVREPLYRSASGRWQRYREQIQPALDILDHAGIDYS